MPALTPRIRWLADSLRPTAAASSAGADDTGVDLAELQADYELIPRGRSQPFQTSEYEVLPKERYQHVARNYYSPIPDLALVPEGLWERESRMGGIDLRAEAAIAFVEQELAAFARELDVPRADPGRPGEFFMNNLCFEQVDAELLYALVRHRRPGVVLELGSGFSSLLIDLAVRRNRSEGIETRHLAFDPYPRPHIIGDVLDREEQLKPVGATEVPMRLFESLRADDILFVDTTHTVKVGSDVNFVVLDVLPTLAPGVLVHFHDIFLPYEYPRQWFEEMRYYWNEQYLLQGFLAFNDAFEVVVPAQALARAHPERLRAAIPSFGEGASPASLWLRRRPDSGTGGSA